MGSQVKKRHRRTKVELLQDPAYCAKHGIKYVKGKITQPILTPEKKPKVKKEVKKAEEPKKRHRRTKAELLQDPVYCAKHGILPPAEVKTNPEPAPEKKRRGKAATSVPDIEDKYLARIYQIFEKVQHEVSEMENELCKALKATQKTLPEKCNEFREFDWACGHFNDAMVAFDNAIDKRRLMS